MNTSTIATTTNDKDNYILLTIVKRYTEDDSEDELLIFGNRFSDQSEVESFRATTLFQNVLKAVESASKNKQIW